MTNLETVTAEQVHRKLEANDDVTVINVLPEDKFAQMHIPGSINIPVDQLEERAEKDLPDTSEELIVYCANASCQASPKAAQKLIDMGYTNVKDFEEGLEGWENAGYEFAGDES